MAAEGVVALVNDVIRRAVAARASDVHFEPGPEQLRIRFRVDALLHDVETLPAGIAANIVARLKVMAGLLTYRSELPQEGSIPPIADVSPYDIRVATFPTLRGERVVLRLLGRSAGLSALTDLGHDPALVERLRRVLRKAQGLLVVCGPAGSGKSTTLAAMLREIALLRPGLSIISLEDPVELRLDGITQVEIAPERGLTFAVALRSLLRQDPQVLMIGEVRDAETVQAVIEAALTGHLLLTSLHSGSPAEALVRLREMGVPPYQLTSTVQAILAQRLVRTCCPSCSATSPNAACESCLGTGFRGRAPVGQLVEMSPELRRAILNLGDTASVAAAAGESGALRADAERLLATGKTTAEEVCRVLGADDPG